MWGNIACIVYDMFTHESESVHGLQFQLMYKLKDLHRQSCAM